MPRSSARIRRAMSDRAGAEADAVIAAAKAAGVPALAIGRRAALRFPAGRACAGDRRSPQDP
jgi:hypothetical protein